MRTALAHAGDGQAAGDDRYLVHVVARAGAPGVTLLDGTPLASDEAGAVACDASSVVHQVGDKGEPLSLGRKTRVWPTAQRRAIMVRDGGCCRFPGCWNLHVDVHHHQPWEEGGGTDVRSGFCGCRRHQRMVHGGYRVEGDPNGELRFFRPDGAYLGSTSARAAVAWRPAS